MCSGIRKKMYIRSAKYSKMLNINGLIKNNYKYRNLFAPPFSPFLSMICIWDYRGLLLVVYLWGMDDCVICCAFWERNGGGREGGRGRERKQRGRASIIYFCSLPLPPSLALPRHQEVIAIPCGCCCCWLRDKNEGGMCGGCSEASVLECC